MEAIPKQNSCMSAYLCESCPLPDTTVVHRAQQDTIVAHRAQQDTIVAHRSQQRCNRYWEPAGLEISSIFSWIFGQFLQGSRVEIFCFACQTSSVDVCDKVY